MSKKTLPIFAPLVVLLLASMACNALTGGGSTSGFQATANAAFTQAAAGAATAGAGGNQALATANAASTEAMATANAATGGNTGGGPTATAAATSAGGGGGGTTSGGPSDVPLVDSQNTILLANAQLVSYQTKADIATVVKFYKDAMPKNGWKAEANLSVETATATVLAFTKDARQAQVSITTDPNSKQTIVLITLS